MVVGTQVEGDGLKVKIKVFFKSGKILRGIILSDTLPHRLGANPVASGSDGVDTRLEVGEANKIVLDVDIDDVGEL